MIPVIIPMDTEEDKCPSCKQTEDKIEVCKHCKHEYKEDEEGGGCLLIIIILLIVFFAFWFD